MTKRNLLTIIYILLCFIFSYLNAFQIFPEQNYYTSEKSAKVIILNDKFHENDSILVEINNLNDLLVKKNIRNSNINTISFDLQNIPYGEHNLAVSIKCDYDSIFTDLTLKKLKPSKNEVRINNFTGGLIVDDLPYFPFGFYCYSPVQPTLAEEEVVKGFNMMSPYQQITKKSLKERRKYMDRCADLGMKIHYNLCSVAGGGGAGSARMKLSDKEIEKILVEEINEFKDHPALLGWYISDEPVLQKVNPEELEKVYSIIKEIDPYHPISIVFMRPQQALKFDKAMDIVMADPYPIPDGSVNKVEFVTEDLYQVFKHKKPVWIVPQAFGGNEWWNREPTKQEMRVMTYLALINNATGIQYFIRHGMNSFPKSTTAWAECGAIALEVAEMTPLLLNYSSNPIVKTNQKDVVVKAWRNDNRSIIIAVNKSNQPLEFTIDLEDKITIDADLIFENRSVNITDGIIHDIIDGFGTRVYEIIETEKQESVFLSSSNLIMDPGFENCQSVGVPSHCYAKDASDKGGTYFIDPRISFEGQNSLRLISPKENGGIRLKFYRLKLKKNQSYTMSLRAKGLEPNVVDRRGFFKKIFGFLSRKTEWNEFRMKLGNTVEFFKLTNNWNEYKLHIPMVSESDNRYIANPLLKMTGKGTGWFDLLQVYPDIEIEEKINTEMKRLEIFLESNHVNSDLYYTIDGSEVNAKSLKYNDAIYIDRSVELRVKVIKNNKEIGELYREIKFHKAVGAEIEYEHMYREKYSGGGEKGLVDANFGDSDFKSGDWQGFEYNDLDVVIDLENIKEITRVKVGCLQNINSWIFLPEKINVFFSNDGQNYTEPKVINHDIPLKKTGSVIHRFSLENLNIKYRYIRIQAVNIKRCPEWHKGNGRTAWLFADEIEIE